MPDETLSSRCLHEGWLPLNPEEYLCRDHNQPIKESLMVPDRVRIVYQCGCVDQTERITDEGERDA